MCRHLRRAFLQHATLWSQLCLTGRTDWLLAKTLLERVKGSPSLPQRNLPSFIPYYQGVCDYPSSTDILQRGICSRHCGTREVAARKGVPFGCVDFHTRVLSSVVDELTAFADAVGYCGEMPSDGDGVWAHCLGKVCRAALYCSLSVVNDVLQPCCRFYFNTRFVPESTDTGNQREDGETRRSGSRPSLDTPRVGSWGSGTTRSGIWLAVMINVF